MIKINSSKLNLKKINKSYSKLTEEDKEYIIKVYYEYKNLKSKDIQSELGISDRAYKQVMKEYNINSKLKNRYTLNENYFENIDTEEKAYILGLIYADGYIGESNNFALSMKDEHIVRDVAKALSFSGEIRICDRGGFENSKECYRLNFSNAKITSDLKKHGVCTSKLLTLNKIPSIKDELYRHFLRGYFDGDGSIGSYISKKVSKGKLYSYKRLKMSLISTESFILEIKNRFNLNGSIRDSKTKELKYLYLEGKEDLSKLYELMYKDATIFLNRKKEIWDNYYNETSAFN